MRRPPLELQPNFEPLCFRLFVISIIVLTACVFEGPAHAQSILHANPSNYLSLLATLQPGDTLLLEPGIYDANGLPVYDLHGTKEHPITIAGPESGPRPVILGHANQNTVRIDDASYVVIKNLEIDCRNLGGDGVNNQGPSHHITLENLYIHGFSDNQGTVGISTNHAPAWYWTIRRNIITDGGTGMYLGNSPGTEPFMAGLIEYNLIYDTIGYNTEIKHQNTREDLRDLPELPLAPAKTIIRHNVFSKANNASTGSKARPNLLVGHFPDAGLGKDDIYEIYGNVFYQNPTGEPLFQGEGNIAFYNNLVINTVDPDGALAAVLIRPHNGVPKMIRVFHNTIVSRNRGISISGGDPAYQQVVVGNAIFSGNPVQAPTAIDNVTDTFDRAPDYLVAPFAPMGQINLMPKFGQLLGPPIDTQSFADVFSDWHLDFNGTPHQFVRRGAYAGEGVNPGWQVALERKTDIPPVIDTIPPAAPSHLQVVSSLRTDVP